MAAFLSEDSVRKPLATAHTRNTFTPTVHKAISTIIGYSFFFDPNFSSDTKYYLPLETFYLALNLTNTKNESWIKNDICERLRTHPFEWNVLNRDKTIDWERLSVLSTVGIETVNGCRYVTYRLNQGFAEKLRASKKWIIYKLANIISLKKDASIKLFEHLFSEFIETDAEINVTVDTLDDIRIILGKEDVHKDYKTFRRDVLEPAIKEIKQKTEIIIDYKPLRQGRKITKIEWRVRRNEKFNLGDDFNQLSLFDEKKLPSGIPIPERAIRLNEIQPLVARMMTYNINRKTATELVQKYGLQRCENQIRNLEAKLASGDNGKIKDSAAWLITAIRDDFSKTAALEKEEQEMQLMEERRIRKDQEKYRAAWHQFRSERGEAKLKQLPDDELDERKRAFIALIENTSDSLEIPGVKSRISVLKRMLEKEGASTSLIDVELRAWLRTELLSTPEELDLGAYIAAQGLGS